MLDQFATTKPAIGMVHLPATPGTPRHDPGRGLDEVIAAVQRAVIVGTALKVGGDTWAPVDGERVKAFMEHVQTAR